MNRNTNEDGGRSDMIDIIQGELSIPPMGPKKLIEVHSFDLEKLSDKDSKRLSELARDITEDMILVFVYYGGSLVFDKKNSAKKVFKTLSEDIFIVDFAPLSRPRLRSWTSSLIKGEGVLCGENEIDAIIDNSLNMLEIESNVIKICAYTREMGKDSVDLPTVLLFTEKNEEAEIYNYCDAVLGRNRKDAFRSLALLKQRRVEPIVINAVLGKTVWNLSSAVYSSSTAELQRSAGLADWQAKKLKALGGRRTRQFFEKASMAILQCDMRMKSESVDSGSLLDELTLKLLELE